jgi:hypothetical protein
MTLMWFDTLGSVGGFMGDDYEAAHVPPRAQAVLADFDRRSAHYEVLDRRQRTAAVIPGLYRSIRINESSAETSRPWKRP